MNEILNKNEILSKIESTLVCFIRPHFLIVNYEESDPPFVHIIISSPTYDILKVNTRIQLVFDLLKLHNLDILNLIPIVVEAYNTKEMEDLLEYYF